MNTTIHKATIEISQEEASDLFYALKHDLEHTVDTHWVFHPSVYSEQSATRFHMMRELSRLLHMDAYASTVAELKLRLERAVKEREYKKQSA